MFKWNKYHRPGYKGLPVRLQEKCKRRLCHDRTQTLTPTHCTRTFAPCLSLPCAVCSSSSIKSSHLEGARDPSLPLTIGRRFLLHHRVGQLSGSTGKSRTVKRRTLRGSIRRGKLYCVLSNLSASLCKLPRERKRSVLRQGWAPKASE